MNGRVGEDMATHYVDSAKGEGYGLETPPMLWHCDIASIIDESTGADIRARVRSKTIHIVESVPGLDFPESMAEAVARTAEAVR